MTKLIAGLVIFLGVHSIRIFAPAWRDQMVAKVGLNTWKMIYSVVALAGFVLIVMGYGAARLEPIVVWHPPFFLRPVAALLMLLVFPLLLTTYFPGYLKAAVKHPMLVATKTWAVAHLLVNGMLADILLFGGFLVWAVIDRIAVGKRGEPAPVAGPIRNDVIAVLLGTLLYIVFVAWAHRWLFGVQPMP